MPPRYAITVPAMCCATVPVKTASSVTSGEPQFMPCTGVCHFARPVAGSIALTRL